MRRIRIILINLFVMGLSACGTNMSKYETPDYEVTFKEGSYEVRRYQPALAAMTDASSENNGFRKIFNFISGENEASEEISMTVPVRMTHGAGSERMAFFMPEKYSEDTLPKPKSADVKVNVFNGGVFAAVRFSGTTPVDKVEKKLAELTTWAESKGFQAGDEWFLDRYDPPWTLWFNRTNEVLIQLVSSESLSQ